MPKRRSTSRTRRRYSAPKRRVRASTYRNLRPRPYRGRGAYSAPKSAAIGSDLGAYLGSAVGLIPGGKAFSGLASMAGSKIGGFLGNKLGKYMGWGAYSVRQNSLMVPEGQSPAQMHTSGNYVRISHREYVADVVAPGNGSSTFATYQVNPGNAAVFPWLYSQAMSYQKYKILGAIWEFKSTTGNFSTAVGANPNVGEVVISSNYNCADPAFNTRTAMENTQYCTSAKPSTSFVHIVECDPALQAQENLYVVENAIPRAQMSINEANWCQTTVATFSTQVVSPAPGQFTSYQLGSLYITYDILLIQPVDRSGSITPTATAWNNIGVTEPFPLGDARSIRYNTSNSINLQIQGYAGWGGVNGNVITLPQTSQGSYFVQAMGYGGTATPYTAPAYSTFTNCSTLEDYDVNNLPFNFATPNNTATAINWSVAIGIRVNGPSPTFVLGGGDIPTGGSVRFIITRIDQDLNLNMPV